MEKVSLAVVGATGLLGQEILSLLAEGNFEPGKIQLSASDDSVGELYDLNGKEIQVVAPDNLDLSDSTLVVLCSPRDVSQSLVSSLKSKSLALVDCSGLDRETSELKIMPDSITKKDQGGAFSIKSACGFMITAFLSALELRDSISNLSATTLEPVSGAGRAGLDELWNQTRAIFNQTAAEPEFFPEQIAFNVLSQVDVMRDDGQTAYEHKVKEELKAINVAPAQLSISALRVPTMYGCGVSLSFETSKHLAVEEIVKALSLAGFALDEGAEQPPSTISVIGDDRIHAARIRVTALPNGSFVSCWLVADNIRACIARPIVDLYRSLMPVE